MEMLEETYFKFKKNILLKMKKMQPNFQEPVVEYCEPEQIIDICSYNHYPVLDKSSQKQEKHVQFDDFPLEQFSDTGRVTNKGDPQLKAAAETELYELEKRAIQIDIDKNEYENSSDNTDDTYYDTSSPCTDDNSSKRADDNSSLRADENERKRAENDTSQSADDDDIQQNEVSHVQLPTLSKKYIVKHDDKVLQNRFTDLRMCHIMKTARNYYCRKHRKQQICHEKTI